MTVYLPDTHAIYWNEFDDPKLSPTVKRAFIDAEQGRAAMVIHPIVIAELIWMLKKLKLDSNYLPYVKFLRNNPAYRFDAITMDDLTRLPDFADVPEMHDRLIVVAADRLGATILTNDRDIRSSARATCVW